MTKIVAYNWEKQTHFSMYLLRFKNYCYIIKMKSILDTANLTLWGLINFSIKKAGSINACLKASTIRDSLAKNSIKKSFIGYWDKS